MNVDTLTIAIIKLGHFRGWWNVYNPTIGLNNKRNYVRIGSDDLSIGINNKIKNINPDEILKYLKEIIYNKIPNANGCGIKLYYSNNDKMMIMTNMLKTEPHIIL